jgi:hypothetical protein
MELKDVKAKDVKAAVKAAINYDPELDGKVKASKLVAVKVTFKDEAGNAVDPAEPVQVKLTTLDIRDMDEPILVHVLDKKKAKKAGKIDADGNPMKAEFVEQVSLVNQNEEDTTEGTEDTLKFESDDCGTFVIAELKAIEEGDLKGICKNISNVFEDVIVKKYPVIGGIKSTMMNNGALASAMTGSGSAVFGIFSSAAKADECAKMFYPDFDEVYSTITL